MQISIDCAPTSTSKESHAHIYIYIHILYTYSCIYINHFIFTVVMFCPWDGEVGLATTFVG